MGIFSFFTSGIGRIIGLIGLAMTAVVGIFLAGKRDQRKDEEIADKEAYIETRKKIDEAVEDSPSDAATALEQLRKRNRKYRKRD